MAELTIGAIALASLFSTCIDCFDYFKSAQDFSHDSRLLLVKLDLEKTRLLVWGNVVGILEGIDDGRSPLLREEHILKSLNGILEELRLLFADADRLQRRYGLKLATDADTSPDADQDFVSPRSMDAFRRSYKKFFSLVRNGKARLNVVTRTRWAIRDKDSFEVMISHIRYFIDGLHKLLPIPTDAQSRIVEHEIEALGISKDIERLRLIESASVDSYPAWSSRANAVIEASEDGTVYHRIEDWISYAEAQTSRYPAREVTQPVQALPMILPEQCEFKSPMMSKYPSLTDLVSLPYNAQSFFVVTGQCDKTPVGEPLCGGPQSLFSVSGLGAGYTKHKGDWNIGERISREIKIDYYSLAEVGLHELETRKYKYLEIHSEFPSTLAIAYSFIYCALCVHQITTAITFCYGSGVSQYVKFLIRVDDRLPVRCKSITPLQSMENLLAKVRERPEFDVPFIEHRIYELESYPEVGQQSERYQHAEHHVDRIFKECRGRNGDDLPCIAIVILTESSSCSETLECPPFPLESRRPRETDIFEMVKSYENETTSWKRRYVGAYPKNSLRMTYQPNSNAPPVSLAQAQSARSSSASFRQLSPPASQRSKRRRLASSLSGSAVSGKADGVEQEGHKEDELE